jgi:putative ABC transport system permease protein
MQDLKYSLRSLAAHRTYAVLSVLCLTLAIGTNATVFTFVNALLLRPLPIPSPDRLFVVQEARHDAPQNAGPASYSNFRDWQQGVADVAQLAALRAATVRVADGGPPERYVGAYVSGNLFAVLGVRPAIGRGFRDGDQTDVASVVVSHSLWQQRFQSDPGLVGRTITINGAPRTVIGVMPAAVSGLAMQPVLRGSRLWLPLEAAERGSRRDERRLTVYARLSGGFSAEAASVRFRAVARALEETYQSDNGGWGVALQRLRVGFSTTTRTLLFLVMGAVVFVLLIACANVANLTLARTAGRRHEIATRIALGASGGRIVRQLLTESLIIAGASVPLGIAVAYWGRQLLLGTGVSPEPTGAIEIDRQVLVFTIGLAVLSSVASGLAPTLLVIRQLDRNVLASRGERQGIGGPSNHRLSQALLIAEVALSIVLLVGASLFIRSFRNLMDAEGGFDTSKLLALGVETSEDGTEPDERAVGRVMRFVDRLSGVPGVETAAAANLVPLRDGGIRGVAVPDSIGATNGNPAPVLVGGVTSGFFSALGVPILHGREFTVVEGRSRSAVAIVNRSLAQRFWPNEDAVGRAFRWASNDGDIWFTIVGVSEDILTWDLSNRTLPAAYVPYGYVPVRDPTLLVRANGDPAALAAPARQALQAAEPMLPVLFAQTMTEVHYLALSRQQTIASMLSVLSAIALLLGATGVYGVFSSFIAQRRYEIGIRAALGADRRTIVAAFVKQGMVVASIGLALGCAGAWGLGRLARGQLRDVSPADPVSYAVAGAIVMAVALAAIYLPARRAGSVDPLVAIRN